MTCAIKFEKKTGCPISEDLARWSKAYNVISTIALRSSEEDGRMLTMLFRLSLSEEDGKRLTMLFELSLSEEDGRMLGLDPQSPTPNIHATTIRAHEHIIRTGLPRF